MITQTRAKFLSVGLLTLLAVSVVGCKADRDQIESAVMGSIYLDRSFFDTVCGFPLKSSLDARVEIVDIEGEALPWLGFWPGKRAPGTATIRITDVSKQGEDTKQTCQAKIGFMWRMEKQPITNRNHKAGETMINFIADGFQKL